MRLRYVALAFVVFTSSALAGPIWMRRSESLLPDGYGKLIDRVRFTVR